MAFINVMFAGCFLGGVDGVLFILQARVGQRQLVA